MNRSLNSPRERSPAGAGRAWLPSRIGPLLGLVLSLLIVGIVSALTVLDLVRQQRLMADSRLQQSALMVRTIHDVVADALYFRDAERLRSIGEIISGQPEVRFFQIFDRDGRLIVARDNNRFPTGTIPRLDLLPALNDGQTFEQEGAEGLEIYAPVQVGSEVLGGVHLSVNESLPTGFVRAAILGHLWQSLVVLAIAIGVSVLLTRYLTRPLRDLAETAGLIGQGELDVAVDTHRRDEIGDVARAICEMARRLRIARLEGENRRAALEGSNIELQREVEERKRAQNESDLAKEELAEALEVLRRAQEKELHSERLRVMGQMASGVAHDINNTLQMILSGAEDLCQQLDEAGAAPRPIASSRESQLETARQIAGAAGDGAEVVRRLASLFKPSPLGEGEVVAVDDVIAETVRFTAPRWRDEAQAAGLDINLKIDAEPCAALCGASELRESLVNLLFNALDASSDGATITVRSRQQGENIVLEVVDEGCGMSPPLLERCREPFVTGKGPSGTGLGLASVDGFVRGCGGSLEIASALDKGTTVRMLLPVAVEGAVQPTQAVPAASQAPASRSILVVDDESHIRRLMSRLMTRFGHHVTTAADAEEALALFEPGRFDLVVTDRAMPGLNGERLASALCSLDPHLPVILLTGFGSLMNAKGEQPEYVREVLEKPVEALDLQRAIERTARNSSAAGHRGEPLQPSAAER